MKITSLNDLENLCLEWVKERNGFVKTIEMTPKEYEQSCQAFDLLRGEEILAFENANQIDDVFSQINRNHFKPSTPDLKQGYRWYYMGFDITIKITEDEMPQEAI